ncbi:hypothetical protein J7643_06740 [bacterium]|nr:hypothetical protein [bacterium]
MRLSSRPEISEAELDEALDRIILAALAPVSAGLALLMIALAFVKPIAFAAADAERVHLLANLQLGLGLLFSLIAFALSRLRLPARMAHPVVFGLLASVLALTVAHMVLLSRPLQSVTFMICAFSMGFLLLSIPWFVLSLLAIAAAWVTGISFSTVAPPFTPAPLWVEFGLHLVQAFVLASMGFGIRRWTYRRLEVLRLRDQRHVADLEAAMREIEESHEKLKELDRLKTDFVNAVSHELRTPLTSIIGFAELLEDHVGGALSKEQLDFVHQIQMGSSRLDGLVNDLLDCARIDAGTFRLKFDYADLGAKIREIVDSLLPQGEASRLAFSVTLPSEPVMLWMDSQRIGQVLLNLLSNAVKFTPVGGRVTVQVRCEEGMVRCEITDSGTGIPEQDLPKLFQRFSQLDDGRRLGQGTGLGLSISKALIEAHGGTIGVRSQSGAGSTFYFSLPMAQPAALLPEAEAVVRADQPAPLVASDTEGD